MLSYAGRLHQVNRTVAGLTNNILSATDFAYPVRPAPLALTEGGSCPA
jgi:hypothetical protein